MKTFGKLPFLLLGPAIILTLYLLKIEGLVLYYPAAISFALGMIFFLTQIYFKPCLVLRLAKIQEPSLPPEAYSYCSKLNAIWIMIMFSNCAIAFTLAYIKEMDLWALYNGFISYIVIFGFMGLEYMYRQRIKAKRNQSKSESK